MRTWKWEEFIEYLRGISSPVKPRAGVRVIERDPKDDVILATALSARADYLVLRDMHLLDLQTYEGISIVTPEMFIGVLRGEAG